nr:MAG TPA: hypothetical protein [Caudoviricetes sp.]
MSKLEAYERNAIRRALQNCDDAIDSIRADYSGRYMYGRTCFGIVTTDPYRVIGSMSMDLGMNGYEDLAIDLYSNVCTDNMGMSTIIYFPDVEWNHEEESEDVEDFLNNEEEEDEEY